MEPKPHARRRHSAELKAQVLMQCAQPGASMVAIAQEHRLNANLVHKWRRHAKHIAPPIASACAEFVALSIPPAPMPTPIADTSSLPRPIVPQERGSARLKKKEIDQK